MRTWFAQLTTGDIVLLHLDGIPDFTSDKPIKGSRQGMDAVVNPKYIVVANVSSNDRLPSRNWTGETVEFQ